MNQTQNIRQTMRRFGSEMERLMVSSFVNLPASLEMLLDALESEPIISGYLNDCTSAHVPDDFDAAEELQRVADSPSEVFGPFPTDHQAAAGEAYLVLQEMLRRRVKFHDPLFVGYVEEPAHPRERFGAFKADVIMRLIDDVAAQLDALAAEAGIERCEEHEADAGAKPAEPVAAGGFDEERLERLLAVAGETLLTLPEEDQEDARLQFEALRDELMGRDCKKSVVRVLLRALKMMGQGPAWRKAIAELEQCLQTGGLC